MWGFRGFLSCSSFCSAASAFLAGASDALLPAADIYVVYQALAAAHFCMVVFFRFFFRDVDPAARLAIGSASIFCRPLPEYPYELEPFCVHAGSSTLKAANKLSFLHEGRRTRDAKPNTPKAANPADNPITAQDDFPDPKSRKAF